MQLIWMLSQYIMGSLLAISHYTIILMTSPVTRHSVIQVGTGKHSDTD